MPLLYPLDCSSISYDIGVIGAICVLVCNCRRQPSGLSGVDSRMMTGVDGDHGDYDPSMTHSTTRELLNYDWSQSLIPTPSSTHTPTSSSSIPLEPHERMNEIRGFPNSAFSERRAWCGSVITKPEIAILEPLTGWGEIGWDGSRAKYMDFLCGAGYQRYRAALYRQISGDR